MLKATSNLNITLRNATDDWQSLVDASPLLGRLKSSLGVAEFGYDDESSFWKCSLSEPLRHLQDCQRQVLENPYILSNYVQLSGAYELLEYHDLAVGEAYKGILLFDELTDDSAEYHELSMEASLESYLQYLRSHQLDSSEAEDQCVSWNRDLWLSKLYTAIVRNLVACGSLRSAFELSCRGLTSLEGNDQYKRFHDLLLTRLRLYCESSDTANVTNRALLEELPEQGHARRELYPWNEHEKSRYSPESLDSINAQLEKVAPELEARVVELPLLREDASTNESSETDQPKRETVSQLGLFAKTDLQPGEIILNEKSLLTASARLLDTVCDACSAPIAELGSVGSSGNQTAYCSECDITVFCSPDCLEKAQESYHSAICGKDVENVAKDAPAQKAADSLYSLLLLRAMAMAETQDVHPLDLDEVRFIWGDYHQMSLEKEFSSTGLAQGKAFESIPRTLPFTFENNISLPLHMLEKMDVNIFDNGGSYDFWVLNTLYAKFRGTASARQGPDGKPDVGAVHPLWCLANHSCDPNVAWDWQGSIKFWVRETRKTWDGMEKSLPPGVKKGSEILSHYTDIDLGLKDRREWAAGALGGNCMCDRCRWEEKYEHDE